MTSTPPDSPAPPTVDLTNCDREPIHLLGRVQSYGALLAVSSDWIVQHASENLSEILGIGFEDALGRPLAELIVSDGFDRVRQNLRAVENPDGCVRLFNVTLQSTGRAFDVSLHQSGQHLIVEFEPKLTPRGRDVMTEVYPHIAALRRNNGLETLARDAARGLQAISGFDSVMVYKFQPDQSGRVLAEQRLDGQKRYGGMAFPASDIPAQARTLYKRSLLRLIADINDPGSVIRPGLLPGGAPLDLSLAVTRAVSPIHIEYLRNMGIEASMSVSIIKDGELWGLFACHHQSPRYIDYERRTAVEMFGHMFSYELSRHEDEQRKIAATKTSRLQTMLMGHMADGRPLSDSLLDVSEDISEIIPHDGLVLFEKDRFFATGQVPTQDEFLSISRMLDRSIGTSVFASDHLGNVHEPAREYEDRITGLLAVPISRRPRDYLVLFRGPVQKTVKWAGNPEKPVTLGPNGSRLTPRKSFELWQETVSGYSAPWLAEETHAAEILRQILLEVFLKVTDASNLERKRASEQQQLLISELNHRVRNILNLMRGLLAQTKSTARTLEEFTENLDGRIHALARAHDQLTSERWEPTSLKSLIQCEFAAYADTKSQRVIIRGRDAMIQPRAYTTLALVLHEMATNSIKYGALCDQSGQVHVDITFDHSDALLLSWKETGGPPVQPPKRRGFGSMIIEESIPHELRGDAEIDYKISGVEARFRIPANSIASVAETDEEPQAPVAPKTDAQAFRLSGRGLVLEDTLIIAMDAAGILESLGAAEVTIQSSVQSALSYLDSHEVDFALLDVNLGDEQSVAVAERLSAANIPFVLATGYGAAPDLLSAYPPCEVVQKPFSGTSLSDALARAFVN
ncbi:HWE histidine kinase domain-containing protein [Pseudooceanicola sp. C21-150M6]|uniref:HWE histidine kinase domain-containing protein n=1 Tax=Pseudooceanicola sp. C21-150M6 TaxID=3434355 RepID=UPI003D7FB8DB